MMDGNQAREVDDSIVIISVHKKYKCIGVNNEKPIALLAIMERIRYTYSK